RRPPRDRRRGATPGLRATRRLREDLLLGLRLEHVEPKQRRNGVLGPLRRPRRGPPDRPDPPAACRLRPGVGPAAGRRPGARPRAATTVRLTPSRYWRCRRAHVRYQRRD